MYRVSTPPASAVELAAITGPTRWWRLGDDHLEAFLGSQVRVGPRVISSLDYERRVRFSPYDEGARWEELDPGRGVTRASHRARAQLPRPASEARPLRALWHASVLGRCVRQVCFEGRPRALGGHPLATEARLVRLLAYDDGVCIVRVAAGGAMVGDTWHERVHDAMRQLEHEYGPHLGRLRGGGGICPPPVTSAWRGLCRSRDVHTV